jgi:molecular chaperone DnaK
MARRGFLRPPSLGRGDERRLPRATSGEAVAAPPSRSPATSAGSPGQRAAKPSLPYISAVAYQLGVDLGTTYTAAAIHRDGKAEIVSLGDRSAAIPSVVFLRSDEEILTGDAANRRGITEPSRVAREFKRRVGDTTPLLLGGTPYSAESLMAKLLGWVVATVSKQEGGPPDEIAVSHPANWGPFKTDLLGQAVRLAGLAQAEMLTEPQAAAIYYASTERVEAGDVVAVYDLGGGTFDAAVLRKTAVGFDILGAPEGIERMGGIDFDEAVFAHVRRAVGTKVEELDPEDETALAAVGRLREECIQAKEALSTDTDVAIPVLLPNVQTEVRLTRAEFEAMVRPALTETISALRRALESAKLQPADVKAVLLVGGSSRIPLVSQMVGAEIGRPVAVDAHPKHAIALGAAIAASGAEQPAEVIAPKAEEEATMAATPVERDADPTVAEPATSVAEPVKQPSFVRTEPAPARAQAQAQMSMPLLVVSAILAVGAVGALVFRLIA